MGDNTTEHIFSVSPALVAAFLEESAAGDVEAVFDAVGALWENADASVKFDGYSYDHMVCLPWLVDLYGDASTEAITEYDEIENFAFRVVSGRAVGRHAKGLVTLLERVKRGPEKLLPPILGSLKKTHELSLKSLSNLPSEGGDFWAQKMQELADETGRAVREFSMTGDDIIRLMTMGRPPGFGNGETPEALRAFEQQHTPRSSLASSLAQSFSFLQMLIEPYDTASAAGQDILHLQIYG